MLWWLGVILLVFFGMAVRARVREMPGGLSQLAGAVSRLGDVIYWAASALAAALLLTIAISVATQAHADQFMQGLGAMFAVGIWLAGRAARYVLAGR